MIRNTLNSCATVYHGTTDTDHNSIRPPKSGKYAMAADNLAFISYMAADAFRERPETKKILRRIGHAAAFTGLIVGSYATTRYIKGDFDGVRQ